MPFLFFQEESEVSLGVASFTGGSICEDFEVKDSKSCGWSTPSAWGFIASWLRDCSQLLSSTLLTGSSFHLAVFEQSVPFLLHITVLTPYVVEQQLDSLECINIPS